MAVVKVIVMDLVAEDIVDEVILTPFSLLLSGIVHWILLLLQRFGLLGFPMNVYELGIYKTKYSPALKYI